MAAARATRPLSGTQTHTSAGATALQAPPATQTLRYTGCEWFRQRLVLATLSGRKVRIDGIRSDDERPGVRAHEASFLRLLESFSHGCVVEINDTGTSVKYKPGFLVGGNIEHDCGLTRGIGWFIEGVLPLLPFGKRAATLTLTGITDDASDLTCDMLRTATLPLIGQFGLAEGLSLTIKRRGCRPLGGGAVLLTVPVVRALKPIDVTSEGFVRRVRGVAFTSKVPPHTASRIVEGARGVLLKLLPDVHIYTDHSKGADAGASPGYGVTLSAATTAGCTYAAQRATGVYDADAMSGSATESPELPEDMGARAALQLVDEIERGGCIDTLHQPIMFTLMALCPEQVSRLRIGALGEAGIATLRLLRDFFGLTFKLSPETRELKGTAAASRAADATEGSDDETGSFEDLEIGAASAGGSRAAAGQKRRAAAASESDEDLSDDDDEPGDAEDDEELDMDGSDVGDDDEDVEMHNDDDDAGSDDDDEDDDVDGDRDLGSVASSDAGAEYAPPAVITTTVKSVLVTCVGVGFQNVSKKVT